MKNGNYLLVAILAAATLMTPMKASALSIADYEHQNGSQQTASYDDAVLKALKAAYNTQDPAIIAKYGSSGKYGDVVKKYFTTAPQGYPLTLGFIAFQVELKDILSDPKTTSSDLTTYQVDDIITLVLQTDLPMDLAKLQKAK